MEELYWPKYLERKSISKMLESGLKLPLLLVVAPLGYGKTIAVQEFLENKKEVKKIWIEFGQNEIDDVWIWQRICEKCKKEKFKILEQILKLSFPKTKQQITYFLQIIKTEVKEPFYIVVDNFHEYNSQFLNQLIEALVYEKIPNFHIIIISRTYPNICYDEMWMKGYCFLIEQGVFTLSEEEIEEFFSINGVSLKEEEIKNIYFRTEGWMSAIYLILLDYKRTHTLRSLQSMSHLMKTSVYDKLPENLKNLFMKMSLFDNFTAEQAAYISGWDFTPAILYDLAEKIGFIKHDDSTSTYQLHTLLKLVANVELEKSNIDKRNLFFKCAQWYEKEKEPIHAIQYYQKAEETEAIFRIIEQEHCYILYEQAPVIISNFFHEVSLQERLLHEKAYLIYIYTLLIRGNFKEGKRLFEEAKAQYIQMYEETILNEILGELFIIEAFLAFNDLEEMTKCMKKAYELLKNKSSKIFDSRIVLTYGTPGVLVLHHNKVGYLKETVQLGKKYVYYYMRLVNGVEGGWDGLFEAEYQFAQGHIEQAEQLALVCCEKAKFRKQVCVIISSYFLLLRCDIYLGRKNEFQKRMQELKKEMKGQNHPLLVMDYDMAVGYLYGILKQADKIAKWISDFQLNQCTRIVRSVRDGCIIYGLILIKNKQWIQLGALAEEICVPYDSSCHVYVMIYGYIYRSISAYHLKEEQKAVYYLKEAIALAQPDGLIMPFVEYVLDIYPILKEISKTVPYAKKLLSYCAEYEKGIEAFIEEKEEMDLTPREWELMKFLMEGCKNVEIGDKMGIALVTVEKTLTRIYRKLDVTSRTAAIAKIRKMNLK